MEQKQTKQTTPKKGLTGKETVSGGASLGAGFIVGAIIMIPLIYWLANQ